MSRGSGGQRAAFLRGLIAGIVVALIALAAIEPLRETLLPGVEGDRVEEARDVIENSYFRSVGEGALDDASIEGMVRRLRRENEDRFSHYFDPETYERFESSISGEFSGVGLTVSEVDRGLRVARVFPDTPAAGAGIEQGDLIVAVNGKSIAGESSSVSSARIKGPPGSEVELTVIDRSAERRRDLTLERAEVRIPAVEGELRERDGEKIAYVQLFTFSQGAHGELRSEIERLYREGAEGLVLDLRGNGGGLLQEALLVTSIFQEDGPVVITEGRSRPRETLEATGDALDPRPTAVLTNGDTASASEIVAAALQQNDLATIVGTKTFGKGTFQERIELDGGAALELTVGEYLTADGSSILDRGVRPDIRVAADGDGDAALRRALGNVAQRVDGS